MARALEYVRQGDSTESAAKRAEVSTPALYRAIKRLPAAAGRRVCSECGRTYRNPKENTRIVRPL